MKSTQHQPVSLALVIPVILALTSIAHSQALQRIWSPPASGTFWSMQLTNYPPLPFLPEYLPEGTPVYLKSSNGAFIYDDLAFDYAALNEFLSATTLAISPEPPGLLWGPNDLWLEIQLDDQNPGYALLILHGTTTGLYQWVATTTLNIPFAVPPWTPGQIYDNFAGSSTISWPARTIRTIGPMRFFRAVGGDTIVSIDTGPYIHQPAEPCTPNETGQVGSFRLTVTPPVDRQLEIVHTISGSAENGLDYTYITNTLVVPSNTSPAYISIQPTNDSFLEFEETVTLTLVVTNGYLVDPAKRSATHFIQDCVTNFFTVVATNVPSPIEIGYHAPTDSLLLSVNYKDGQTNNFARLNTNGVLTAWSPVAGVDNEVKFAIPKATAHGWTNGCVYFGSGTSIAYMSSNADTVVAPWTTLTNSIVTNALHLRGSLAFDETGIWSNNLIAVTSDEPPDLQIPKGVWTIAANAKPFLVANISTPHLEGVTALPNDLLKWGPWAGKLLTGDETAKDQDDLRRPLIYAIDTNGVTTAHSLDIEPEDFDIVPPDQDLYCVNFNEYDSRILKISQSLLTNAVGDLVITQAGEYNPYEQYALKPKPFFVHWNGTNFTTRSIPLPPPFPINIEHVTFAPIQIPDIPQ